MWLAEKLDMSTAHRHLKSPRSLSGTSAHPIMVTLVNITSHERMTHILFIPCQSTAPFLRYSNFRLWPWNSKVKVMGVVKRQGHTVGQYHLNSLPVHFTSIRPTIPEIQLFRNLTLKHPRSRSWVRSKVKVTYYTQYRTDALPFRFTSIGPTIPEIWPT